MVDARHIHVDVTRMHRWKYYKYGTTTIADASPFPLNFLKNFFDEINETLQVKVEGWEDEWMMITLEKPKEWMEDACKFLLIFRLDYKFLCTEWIKKTII